MSMSIYHYYKWDIAILGGIFVASVGFDIMAGVGPALLFGGGLSVMVGLIIRYGQNVDLS